MKHKFGKPFQIVLKFAILAGLISIIRGAIDTEKLATQFGGIKIGYLALALLCMLCTILVMGWRLAYIARVPLGGSMVCQLKAFFYNNFLPAQLGGDVYRAYHLSKRTGEIKRGLAIVFSDRLIGMTGGVSFAVINVLIGHQYFTDPTVYKAIVVYVGLVAIAFVIVFFLPDSVLESWGRRFPLGGLAAKIKLTRRYAKITLRSRALGGMAITLLCYLFLIGMNVCAMYTLGLQVSVVASVLYMPVLAVIVLTLPISFNGLGVRESVYMLIFSMAGYTYEESLAMALVQLICIVCLSVVCGFVALAAGDRVEAVKVVARQSN